MSIKYYTHFLLRELSPNYTHEYSGVVEVNRALPSGRTVEAVLAKTLECDRKAIDVLEWSRLQ